MAKIMLVEDDTNLAEIYEARLQAEGYQIVAAHDGEAALALAAKEKPDLILSDVMMPKISGFEMLDILRNTQGLKDAKVIMLTALGQAEDKTRAEGLGADRYLVKSQVTLEDIVKAVQELLAETSGALAGTPAPTAVPTPAPAPQPAGVVVPAPAAPVAAPAQPPTAVAIPVAAPPTVPTPTAPPATPAAAPVLNPAMSAPTTNAPIMATPVPAPPVVPAPNPPTTVPIPVTTPAPPEPAPSPTHAPQASATNPPIQPAAVVDDKIVSDAVNELLTETAAEKTQMPAPASVAPSAIKAEPATEPIADPAPTNPPPTVPITIDVTDEEKPPSAAEPAAQEEAAIEKQIASFAEEPDDSSKSAEPANSPKTAPPVESSKNDNPAEPSDNDNVTIAHKKVIKPISGPETTKPSLSSLLEDEERKNPGTISQPVITGDSQGQTAAESARPAEPHQPGHIIAPDVAASSPNTDASLDPNDPNNIAL